MKKSRISTSRKRLLLGSLAGLALLAATSGAISVNGLRAEAPGAQKPHAEAVYMTVNFADVIEAVSPAVVSIEVSRPMHLVSGSMEREEAMPFEEFFKHRRGPQQRGPHSKPHPQPHGNKSSGSGFIIDSGGYVVTNSHVIDGGEEIFVTLMDGTRLAATLIGGDAKSDLALLKIDAPVALPALNFGDSTAMRVGSPVVALGNPFGLGHSATMGIISARGRGIGSGPYDDFLQIDAPINPGNSGGPLFNTQGEVIGVNTAIFSPSGGNVGIGFAIPAALAQDIVADLMDDGKVERAWLGVAIQQLSDEMAESLGIADADGAIVSEVMAGSPAAAAGMMQGDVILSVNDVQVKELRDLTRTIARLKVGAPALLSVWRRGETLTIEAKVGTPSEAKVAAQLPEGDALEALGVRLAALDDAARQNFSIGEEVTGVVVTDLQRSGIAAGRGIRPGDVIVSVGNEAVSAPDEVAAGIRLAEENKRQAVLLLMNRNGQKRYVALPLPKA
ncbi:MAG: Do family serine endopeptidase [Proteobacteria bacterium]|nr:Do family serine endopeptidase [Pseudomonadota bacterium]MDA1357707.1 Do family serine endopeptidase [Pseudomonadota bacterium]